MANLLHKHPGGGGYSHTLPIWVCVAQRGRDFEAPDLERGYPFQRRFLERGIIVIFNKMGNKKVVDHGFIFCLKLLLIKKHLFDV